MCLAQQCVSPCLTDSGNTIAESDRARSWCFTLNNYSDAEYESILSCLRGKKDKWIVGKEVGENGTPHLQGYFYHNLQTRFGTLKKWNKRIHWEIARASADDNWKYCSKDEDFVTNYKPVPPYMGEDLITADQLYEWQLPLIKLINGPWEKRTVHWFWSKCGGVGKSDFAKYCAYHYPNVKLITVTKSADILTCVDRQYNVYILDFPRSLQDFFPYNAIEQMKNGYVQSSKLQKHAKETMSVPNHVICFANCEPKYNDMSDDRWVVKQLGKKGLCKDTEIPMRIPTDDWGEPIFEKTMQAP